MTMKKSYVLVMIGVLILAIVFLNFKKEKGGALDAKITAEKLGAEVTVLATTVLQGKTYRVMSNGKFYEVLSNGQLKFIQQIFNPNYPNNYVTINGEWYFKDPSSGKLHPVTKVFKDGFEQATTVEDLMSEDRWHRYDADPNKAGQQHNFYNQGSRAAIATTIVHAGTNAFTCHTPVYTSLLKSQIIRSLLHVTEGDEVYFSFWVYLEDVPSIERITLFDLESEWISGSPGMRIYLDDGALAYEMKALHRPRYKQPAGQEKQFPTGQWVSIEGYLIITENDDGVIELWQDGDKIIDTTGQTLPWKEVIYDKVLTCITANPAGAEYAKTMYIDDFSITVEKSVTSLVQGTGLPITP